MPGLLGALRFDFNLAAETDIMGMILCPFAVLKWGGIDAPSSVLNDFTYRESDDLAKKYLLEKLTLGDNLDKSYDEKV